MKRYACFMLIGVAISLCLVAKLKYSDYFTRPIVQLKYSNFSKTAVQSYGYADVGDNIWRNVDFSPWFDAFKRDIAILGNHGGMRFPHQFAMYTILRIIRPSCVIESGIFKGVTTQIIRKTLPEAHIISLDPVCNNVAFQDKYEIYCGKTFKDFKDMGNKWQSINKNKTIVIFDDHQSGFHRILQSKNFGFKYVVIEDNYPFKGGDNYSPKQVFTDVDSDVIFKDNLGLIQYRISREQHYINRQILKDAINVYAEFPPLNKKMTAKWLSENFLNQNSEADLYQMMTDGLEIHVPFDREYLLYHFIALIEIKQ